VRTAAVVVAGTLLGAALPEAQRFSSGVDLVMVDALATDGRRPLAGLTAADFELLDNGVPQAIQLLQLERQPLNVILVLDTSASVRGPRLTNLKAAAASIVKNLGAGDRASLLSFSHRLELRTPLTPDRSSLLASIASLDAQGSTALFDAVSTGMVLRGTDAGRALLLLFSDGVDTASFLLEPSVLAAAARADVIVYPIAVRGRAARLNEPPADERFLRALAAETGGRLEHADGDDDIDKAFARVFEEFKRRYVLGYVPTGVPRSGWHTIEVRLRNRKGTVTARRGYFGP
jgi:VWFA-related protein